MTTTCKIARKAVNYPLLRQVHQGLPFKMHTELSDQQHVTLYPSYVFFDREAGEWRIPLSAFVHADGSDGVGQKVFMRLLQQVLDVDEEQLKLNEWFADRIPGFLRDPQRGKEIVLTFDEGKLVISGKSGRSGHLRFSTSLPPANTCETWKSQAPRESKALRYSVVLPENDTREIASTAEVIPPRGVSVISDIDDTIKISQVAHRRQLLHNTFLHGFVPVPGMALLFSKWKSQGAAFHYVSSSPWQLFRPLDEFLRDNQFPNGSFHLRTYSFSDPTILKLFLSRKRNKYKIIEAIFKQFPERQFVLVGDSGEKDAEIYGKVARRYPLQTKQILIRRVQGRPWTRKRVEKAFRGVPEDSWQAFRVPTQIRDISILNDT